MIVLLASTTGQPIVFTPPTTTPLSKAKYSVEIRDEYGRLITILNRPMNKQFNLFRNKAGSCQFTMDGYDIQAIDANFQMNRYDVVFRRLGTVVFAGQISYLYPRIDGDKLEVDVTATGYFDLLQQRMVNETFPGFDALKQQLVITDDGGTVINDLLTYTQFPVITDGSVKMQGTTPTLNQSFIATGSTTVKQIQLIMQNTSATGNLILGIYPDAGGTPGASPITNSVLTTAVGGIPGSFSWVTFTYSSLPTLVTGNIYWIKCYLDTVQSGSNGISWAYLNNDWYPSGKAYSPENSSLFTATQDLQFFILLNDNSFQMTKKTYLGFNQGLAPASFTITRTLPQFKRLKETIEEVSKLNSGIDFDITVQIDANNNMKKFFNVYYPRQGINNTTLNFSYPGNIKKLSKSRDGKSMLNTAYLRGNGTGIYQVVTTSYDTTSIQQYGLREETEDFSDIIDSGTLQSLGNEYIRVRKNPLDIPEITLDGKLNPQIGSYGIGDTILVIIDGPGLINLVDLYRIEEIHVNIDDDDMEEVLLAVSKA